VGSFFDVGNEAHIGRVEAFDGSMRVWYSFFSTEKANAPGILS
jgi:hypothetical protein